MHNKKRKSLILTGFLILSLLSGCKEPDASHQAENQTDSTEDKIQIKVQYEAGRMNMSLESVLEEKFPDVDIVTDELVGEPEYIIEKEMENNLEPDIYLYEDLWKMDDNLMSERFYDLSREDFTDNYYLSAISDCVRSDGGLYYLPGPIYIYGIVYDKTAFRELNLSIPKSYSEFVTLIQTVNDMDIMGQEPDENNPEQLVDVKVAPFVPTMKWPDMWSIVFNTYNYEDYLRGTANTMWLTDYQEGKESMVGHMEGAADDFLQLFKDGIISTDFWEVGAPVRTQKLYQYHTSLMTIECQSAIGYNMAENENNMNNIHEIGMMPFYTSDEKDSDYVYTMPRCYFGMTKKATADDKKKEAILKIFEFFSTAQGQELLIEGGGGELNLLKDTDTPDDPFYDEIRDTVDEGRTISNFYYAGKNEDVEAYLHAATPDLVKGNISVEQWLKEADNVRDKVIHHTNDEEVSYGTVTRTMTMEETAVIIGEAYIHATGADIGIVPCTASFGMKFRLFEGPITDTVINSIATTRMGAGAIVGDSGHTQLVVVSVTGQELLDLLNSYGDTFVATAGLDVEYAPDRPEGERYVSLKLHGKDLDPSATYTAAVVRGAAKDLPVEKVYEELTFNDMFIRYVDSIGGTISEPPKSLSIVK